MKLGALVRASVLVCALVLGLSSAAGADVRYVVIAAGDAHTCAIKGSAEIACWGDNSAGQANPPTGRFGFVTAGGRHTCAMRLNPGAPDEDTVVCWGDNASGQASAPSDRFNTISAGLRHTCGIRRADAALVCWGDNSLGQTTPPP
ncbi:MAG TPA: RCC1 domain-containing protein, partial [Gemmataceae bacterium]|nr:RCC1 domain-containing protein [Gemmataceae bacterium]